jgi:hypothetical protein
LAESLLTTSRLPSQNDSELSLVFAVTEAKVLARRAARDGIETDLEASLKAMAHLDSVINRVDKDYLKKGTPYLKLFAVKIRFERADLLLLIAKDRADSQIPKAIITEFEALVPRLDAFSEPVATALVFVRLAQAYILLGQIEGDLEQIAQGIGILSRDEASNPYDHSPVDYVIHKQTLGLGLAAMGERTQSQALFEQAIKAMDLALSKPIPSGVMAMLMIYNDRLGIKSAKAESGAFDDLIALISFLKSELKALDAKRAPILWAILQANIARLYIINSEHLGQSKDRLEALYALTAAYDIFEEQGLGALMSTTRHWLARAQTQS